MTSVSTSQRSGSHKLACVPRSGIIHRVRRLLACGFSSRRLVHAAALLLTAMTAAPTQAGVLVDIAEVGSDVVVSWSGSFSSLPTPASPGISLGMQNAIRANISDTTMFLAAKEGEGSGSQVISDGYTITTIAPLGSRELFTTFGGIVAAGSTPFYISNTLFGVLPGYNNGDSIAGSMTFSNQSFLSLALTPGTSVTASIVGGGPSDDITVNVVPEPASLSLMGLAGVALIIAGRFRRLCGKRTAG